MKNSQIFFKKKVISFLKINLKVKEKKHRKKLSKTLMKREIGLMRYKAQERIKIN